MTCVNTGNASPFSSEQIDMQAQDVPPQNYTTYSSSVDQQTPSLVDGRRVDRGVPFYPVPTLPGSPFNFPTVPGVQSLAQFGRTAPPLRKETVYPARQGAEGGHSTIPAHAWVLLVPCFFLFFFSRCSVSGVAQKEKAVVLENPAAPHRTE